MAESVHLLKLCVGAESVEDLIDWHRTHPSPYPTGERRHVTRMWPKREAEVIAGGSLYWVIKGVIRVRHRILRLDEVSDAEGNAYCAIVYDPKVILVEPRPRRAFQGWRYLEAEDSPPDLRNQRQAMNSALSEGEMPPKMLAELRELGLF